MDLSDQLSGEVVQTFAGGGRTSWVVPWRAFLGYTYIFSKYLLSCVLSSNLYYLAVQPLSGSPASNFPCRTPTPTLMAIMVS